MGLKEAKSDPWKKLKALANDADTPNTSKSWNGKGIRKVGDVLMGTVGDTRDTVTPYGPGKVLDIQTPEGVTETLFLSDVLKNTIAGAGGFAKGDKVFVKYLGIPPKKRYSVYAVGKL